MKKLSMFNVKCRIINDFMLQISELTGLKRQLVLASQSPRRKKLLEQLGLEFIIIPSDIEEDLIDGLHPEIYAKTLALKKAREVSARINIPAIVIGADTIVVLDGIILNKPSDAKDAFNMLNKLSGRTHKVYTGIALVDSENGKYLWDVKITEVTFRNLSEDEINSYIATGSPLDKAGAYGIQDDFGAVFVSHINGCYYNIVGLPLELLYTSLKEFLKT